MKSNSCPKVAAPQLTETEKKLLERIEQQAQPKAPRSWIKTLAHTAFGFAGW